MWLLAQAEVGGIVALVTMAVMVIIGIIVYMLPAIIAGMRSHPNTGAITVLTILFGWTFIGWAVALVWSFTSTDARRP